MHQNYLEGLLKYRFLGPTPRIFVSSSLGCGLRICIPSSCVVLMLLAWEPHTSEVTLCVGLASFLSFSFLIWKMGVILLTLLHTLELS